MRFVGIKHKQSFGRKTRIDKKEHPSHFRFIPIPSNCSRRKHPAHAPPTRIYYKWTRRFHPRRLSPTAALILHVDFRTWHPLYRNTIAAPSRINTPDERRFDPRWGKWRVYVRNRDGFLEYTARYALKVCPNAATVRAPHRRSRFRVSVLRVR